MSKPYNQNEAGPGGTGNLRRLSYFVAIVETGSFTAAAERLGITKAVVSQQVARLESEFKTSLLVRTTRKVQVTETGQAFYLRCAACKTPKPPSANWRKGPPSPPARFG